MKIIPSQYISDYKTVRRSWGERLFTRPWRPLVATKQVHDPQIFKHGNYIYCSYETAAKLERLNAQPL